MKIISCNRSEILIITPGFFKALQSITGAKRMARAAAFWPFLLVRDEAELQRPWLLNHERIHLAQMREMLLIGLWAQQLIEGLISILWLRKSREETYFGFSFEQEAYLNQHNLDYLKTRKPFAHFGYLRNKKRFRVTDKPGELDFY
jgi:hypothetical protein